MAKKAILVVSFGTSYKETREKTIDALENAVAKKYPDWEVRRGQMTALRINFGVHSQGPIHHGATILVRLAPEFSST